MELTLNEVIREQKMMVNMGKKLIHATIRNQDHSQLYNKSAMPGIVDNTSRCQDIIANDVELLAANWWAYQPLGHDIQASLSFWEFCELRDMHKSGGFPWNYVGMVSWIKEEDERVAKGAMVGKETVGHTLVDETPPIVEVSIDGVFAIVTEFSDDSKHHRFMRCRETTPPLLRSR